MGDDTEGHEHREHQPVQPLRPDEAARNPELHHQRTQSLCAIELMILRRVDDVEARDPEQHREREHQRRQREVPAHGQPRADWGHREREPEEEMAERREALGERVEEDDQQRDGRQAKAERIDPPRHADERCRARDQQRDRSATRDQGMPRRRARIALIDAPVGHSIESHPRRPRADHRQHDEPAASPPRQPIRRDQHRPERKGQREDRVRKADEPQEADRERGGGHWET